MACTQTYVTRGPRQEMHARNRTKSQLQRQVSEQGCQPFDWGKGCQPFVLEGRAANLVLQGKGCYPLIQRARLLTINQAINVDGFARVRLFTFSFVCGWHSCRSACTVCMIVHSCVPECTPVSGACVFVGRTMLVCGVYINTSLKSRRACLCECIGCPRVCIRVWAYMCVGCSKANVSYD